MFALLSDANALRAFDAETVAAAVQLPVVSERRPAPLVTDSDTVECDSCGTEVNEWLCTRCVLCNKAAYCSVACQERESSRHAAECESAAPMGDADGELLITWNAELHGHDKDEWFEDELQREAAQLQAELNAEEASDTETEPAQEHHHPLTLEFLARETDEHRRGKCSWHPSSEGYTGDLAIGSIQEEDEDAPAEEDVGSGAGESLPSSARGDGTSSEDDDDYDPDQVSGSEVSGSDGDEGDEEEKEESDYEMESVPLGEDGDSDSDNDVDVDVKTTRKLLSLAEDFEDDNAQSGESQHSAIGEYLQHLQAESSAAAADNASGYSGGYSGGGADDDYYEVPDRGWS